jgi:hypothetical protein
VIEAIRIMDRANGSPVRLDGSDCDHPDELLTVEGVKDLSQKDVVKLGDLGWLLTDDGVWYLPKMQRNRERVEHSNN